MFLHSRVWAQRTTRAPRGAYNDSGQPCVGAAVCGRERGAAHLTALVWIARCWEQRTQNERAVGGQRDAVGGLRVSLPSERGGAGYLLVLAPLARPVTFEASGDEMDLRRAAGRVLSDGLSPSFDYHFYALYAPLRFFSRSLSGLLSRLLSGSSSPELCLATLSIEPTLTSSSMCFDRLALCIIAPFASLHASFARVVTPRSANVPFSPLFPRSLYGPHSRSVEGMYYSVRRADTDGLQARLKIPQVQDLGGIPLKIQVNTLEDFMKPSSAPQRGWTGASGTTSSTELPLAVSSDAPKYT
ncbi:hypothetical protein B0H13DRAFT_2316233 [Mycena leptocephala]|nr:hypothetical protein B0H13DRAFT_2316233 [Mycena leptocephala]